MRCMGDLLLFGDEPGMRARAGAAFRHAAARPPRRNPGVAQLLKHRLYSGTFPATAAHIPRHTRGMGGGG